MVIVTAGYFFTNGLDMITKNELLKQLIKKKQDPNNTPFWDDPCPVKKETMNAPLAARNIPAIFVQFFTSVFSRIVITTVMIGWVVCQTAAIWAGEKDKPTMKNTWLKNMHNPTANSLPKSFLLTNPERVRN